MIPFAALVDEKGEYLVKKYHFTYLTSGRDLLRLQEKIQSKTAPVVMADADFNHSADGNKADNYQQTANNPNGKNEVNEANKLARSKRGQNSGKWNLSRWKDSPRQREKPDKVKKVLGQASLFLKSRATETALKQVSSPSILHIATHGFFLEEEVKLGSKSSKSTRIAIRRKEDDRRLSVKLENPALRSGLFFAGANRGQERQ